MANVYPNFSYLITGNEYYDVVDEARRPGFIDIEIQGVGIHLSMLISPSIILI